MNKSNSIKQLMGALNKCEFPPMPRDGTNPFFNSTYVTLDKIIETTTPILKRNGLQIIQSLTSKDGEMGLTTTLFHLASGEFIEDTFYTEVPTETKSQHIQTVGKQVTYLRRYAWSAILGLSTEEDNDGNPASKPQQKQKAQPAPKQEPQQPTNERPYSWGQLITGIAKSVEAKAQMMETKPMTKKNIERYRKVLGKHLTEIWNDILMLDDDARYEYFHALVGYSSTKDMPAPVVMVLLHWLDVDDYEDEVSGTTLVEIKNTLHEASGTNLP